MGLISFFIEHKWILLFYLIVFLLIYINRKKFEIQAKVIALYRTKFGLKFMEKFAKKHRTAIKRISHFSVYIGFLGMIVIVVMLVYFLIKVFLVPSTPAAVAPLIPGIKVGGIYLPFVIGMISIFVAVLIHEFSHGITAIAHDLKIKSSGFGIFAIFPIAFVEPDEKKIMKKSPKVQNSVFAMGPFSNLVLGALSLIIIILVIGPVTGAMVNYNGVTYSNFTEQGPAQYSGLEKGMTITEINGITITDYDSFSDVLADLKPGENITLIANNSAYGFVLAEHPEHNGKAYLGISGISESYELKNQTGFGKWLFGVVSWFFELFFWLYVINLGLGLMNLYPIFITDGARMIGSFAIKKKKYEKSFVIINKICVFILLVHFAIFVLKAIGFGGM